ncbi:uncharacterized protein EDB93DRAFT_1338832 [Suillus bovinus]|uniref:uncharacterized protein n=1 Tax=Suillus bovinus TaxID=48563 RepID=UPI001B8645D3|nr:uncharacterized protein EDB93DRAFT_1338832 [Suillus bovinus]KAG2139808.1 hypothetical protein EDB93DRAFT_1338832 [Suillus bovinus]
MQYFTTDTGGITGSLNAAMHHFKACSLWRLAIPPAGKSALASVSSRHDAMKEFPSTVAADAASCAVRSGDVYCTVELLEQGRTIIWTQMTRLRTLLVSLLTRGDHAMTLMKKETSGPFLINLLRAIQKGHQESIWHTRYRRLVEDWNRTVEETQKTSYFPLSSLICEMQLQPPTSIQLPSDLRKLVKLVLALRKAVNKETGPKGNQIALIKALIRLWKDVVGSVVENLGGFALGSSRIWWYLTFLFNFLPLHAAGEYMAKGSSISLHTRHRSPR